jgi:Domain of unknown function (DUF5668)
VNSRWGVYAQAIRGPVLLIALGTLCAIHQAGVLSLSRTWPLIIIVVGVMKLIERAFLPSPVPPPFPGQWPGAGPGGASYQGFTRTPGAGTPGAAGPSQSQGPNPPAGGTRQ